MTETYPDHPNLRGNYAPLRMESNINDLIVRNNIKKINPDVIFNALHGKDGEDGVAQSYFEYLRIPYTHSGIISSCNAMNNNG